MSRHHLDLLREVFTTTERTLARITTQDLNRSTPCADYTVRQLRDHLIGWTIYFAAAVTEAGTPAIDTPTYRAGPHPVRDYRQAAAAIISGLSHRGEGPVAKNGTQIAPSVLAIEILAEHLIHCWDLATALGQEVHFTADQILVAQLGLTSMLTQPHAPQGFQPPPAPAPAGDQDQLGRLLHRSGRNAAASHPTPFPSTNGLDSDVTSRPTVGDMRMSTVGIGEAARVLGTTPRALRYYETLGLLAPTDLSSGGHRRYNTSSVSRARRILALRALGLPLPDVGAVLDSDDPSRIRAILHDQAARLREQIVNLNTLQERITAALANSMSQPRSDPDRIHLLNLLEDLAMNIQLTSIYTKTGDDGTTDLGDGTRVEKKDPRLEVGGDLDELLSALGLAIAAPEPAHVALLRQIQNDLFDLGASVATEHGAALLSAEYTARLEAACDEINAHLQPPTSFVLPGGSEYTAAAHFARAICRRAERHAWALSGIDQEICRYLNRLSDLLFIIARSAEPATEATWVPAASTTR